MLGPAARRGTTSAASPAAFRAPWALAAVLLATSLVFILHVLRYRPFLADDALISLRYAQRLIEGHGLTWTEGPRVEGYSNLLWILFAAVPGALGVDLVMGVRWLGAACGLAAVWALVWSQARNDSRHPASSLAGGMTVALAGPMAVWAGAGLESPLVAVLLAWSVALAIPLTRPGPVASRHAQLASVPLALLVLTRPDGVLFTASIVLALILARGLNGSTFRLCLWMAALPVVAFAGQQAFRILYYHAWVPNSALVKIAFTRRRIEVGLQYLRLGLGSFWPLWLLAALGAWAGLARSEERGRTWLVVVPMLVWTAYVVAIGGDFFPGFRHLLPTVVLAAFLVANAVRLLSTSPRRLLLTAAVGGLIALFGTLQLNGSSHNSEIRGRSEPTDCRAASSAERSSA